MSMNPPEFVVARVSFTAAAIILSVRVSWWLLIEQASNKHYGQKILFSFLIFGTIGALWITSAQWINFRHQMAVAAMTPREQNEKAIQAQANANQLPVGNLKQRTIALSEEIMWDLYRHGWQSYRTGRAFPQPAIQQMPTTKEEALIWTNARSSFFKLRFSERVREIRNEFAELHLRDRSLDDHFRNQGMVENANKILALNSQVKQIDFPILPQQIEEIAERLKILADQIK